LVGGELNFGYIAADRWWLLSWVQILVWVQKSLRNQASPQRFSVSLSLGFSPVLVSAHIS
jgi:hypothetical protein